MAIQGDIAQYLSGMPVMVAGCNIAISQPTLKDIAAYGEDKFLMGVELFSKTERFVKSVKEGNSRLSMYDDFQVLMAIANEDIGVRNTIDNLFSLILDYDYEYAAGSINFYIKDKKTQGIIGQLNPRNFDAFSRTISELFLPTSTSEDEEEYKPANDKAAEIAAKLKAGREKVKNIKGQETKVRSMFANYISILSIGLAMDIHVLYTYTPFQLYDAIRRFMVKGAYDLYQRISTMPMMDTSKMDVPDNWMDDIYK